MKQNSPYTATITGCGFLYYEFLRILPLLMSKDSTRLLKEEIDNNLLFQVNSQKARLRFLAEMSFPEIARILHRNEEAVKKTIYRLLARLHSQLEVSNE